MLILALSNLVLSELIACLSHGSSGFEELADTKANRFPIIEFKSRSKKMEELGVDTKTNVGRMVVGLVRKMSSTALTRRESSGSISRRPSQEGGFSRLPSKEGGFSRQPSTEGFSRRVSNERMSNGGSSVRPSRTPSFE